MIDELFHTPNEMPEYDKQLLLQRENGFYSQLYYWAMSVESLRRHFKKSYTYQGPVIRWCYIDDLDKIK